jgi:hypothetical protein
MSPPNCGLATTFPAITLLGILTTQKQFLQNSTQSFPVLLLFVASCFFFFLSSSCSSNDLFHATCYWTPAGWGFLLHSTVVFVSFARRHPPAPLACWGGGQDYPATKPNPYKRKLEPMRVLATHSFARDSSAVKKTLLILMNHPKKRSFLTLTSLLCLSISLCV